MKEASPHPDQNGNFTGSNANTSLSEANGLGACPKWQAVDKSGPLNCPVAPNGVVSQK
jgi:hypothetical protein